MTDIPQVSERVICESPLNEAESQPIHSPNLRGERENGVHQTITLSHTTHSVDSSKCGTRALTQDTTAFMYKHTYIHVHCVHVHVHVKVHAEHCTDL